MQETGKDPITGEPASLEDLLPVKTNKAVKPRPSAATSIPGLLGLFHNVCASFSAQTSTVFSDNSMYFQEMTL